MLRDQILALAAPASARAREFRRDFHKYPELAYTEFRTGSLVARRLTELGFSVRLGRDVMKAESRLGVPSAEVLEQCYQRAAAEGADPEDANKLALTVAANVMRSLSDITAEGTAFEVDADLRPEGRNGPLSRSYESYLK